MVYYYMIVGKSMVRSKAENEEIRWQVMKAMLDEFPKLKEKTKKYLTAVAR
jgi:hypothetical protein